MHAISQVGNRRTNAPTKTTLPFAWPATYASLSLSLSLIDLELVLLA